MTIGAKIFEARKAKGYSQGDLAKKSTVYKSTIQRYEKGVNPIRKNLVLIAKALDLPLSHFYEEERTKAHFQKSELSEKVKEIAEFSLEEQHAVETILDMILEKRRMINQLKSMVKQNDKENA